MYAGFALLLLVKKDMQSLDEG